LKLLIPSYEERGFGFRALKAIALADGDMHETELEVIRGGQWLFDDDHDIDALEPITPEELAAGLTDPGKRRQFLGATVIMTMADGEVNEAEAKCLRAFAEALEVDGVEVKNIEHLAKGQFRRARFDTMRRFWAVEKLRQLASEEGVGVYFRTVLGALGIKEDTKTVEKYKAFEHLPPESLGRSYYDYILENEFDWPGSKGAPPAIMIYHDFSHILSGYGTTPQQEIMVAAFVAGYVSYHPAVLFIFVLSQFQLGVQTAPNVEPAKMKMNVKEMILAFRRGAAMNINLNEGWDYMEVVYEPVEVLRERYNVLPREHFLQEHP
jgi:hypothetical protein